MTKILTLAVFMLSSTVAADPTPTEKQRFTDTVTIVGTIKQDLRNPESVKWETIIANDDASIVCVQYRAQNGFGGMGREILVYAKGKASKTAAAWNRHCTGALNDMAYIGGLVDKTYARAMR